MKVKVVKRRSVSCNIKRKKPCFKLPKLIDDPLLSDDILESFKQAFFAKSMNYTTELVYDSPDCPPEKNNPSLEQPSTV
jgi:hypothetical protein